MAAAWLDDQFPLPLTDSTIDLSGSAASMSYSTSEGASSETVQWDPVSTFSTRIEFKGATRAEGYSTEFLRYRYEIVSTGEGPRDSEVEVTVGAGKIDIVGS